ncbi:response regulator [Thermoproteota archaeon]
MQKKKQKKKILIIDDEPMIGIAIKSAMPEYDFVIASCAKHGLDILSRYEFDIVLLDYMMADMDGLEMLKQIRLINESLKIVMITGSDNYSIILKAMNFRANGFLFKPFDADKLMDLIQQV